MGDGKRDGENSVRIKTKFISKRGCMNTIIFPHIDLMPDFLKDTGKNDEDMHEYDVDFNGGAGSWGEEEEEEEEEGGGGGDEEEQERDKNTSNTMKEFDYGRGKQTIDPECDIEASLDYIDIRRTRKLSPSSMSTLGGPGTRKKNMNLNVNVPLCPIYGVPAKYRDPLTNQYYSNIDAFQEIRRKANLPFTTRASSGMLTNC